MTPEKAYEICSNKDKRTSQLENIIATSAYYSYKYARDVLKGRFEKGEEAISTAGNWSFGYAKNVLHAPFHLGHLAIFNSQWRDVYVDFLKEINYDMKEIYKGYGELLI